MSKIVLLILRTNLTKVHKNELAVIWKRKDLQ